MKETAAISIEGKVHNIIQYYALKASDMIVDPDLPLHTYGLEQYALQGTLEAAFNLDLSDVGFHFNSMRHIVAIIKLMLVRKHRGSILKTPPERRIYTTAERQLKNIQDAVKEHAPGVDPDCIDYIIEFLQNSDFLVAITGEDK
jgi:hypothetical protein